MIETLPDVAVAGAVALGVGATHGIAHYAAGNEDTFQEAGVNAAGIAVVIGAFVATWLILNPDVLGVVA